MAPSMHFHGSLQVFAVILAALRVRSRAALESADEVKLGEKTREFRQRWKREMGRRLIGEKNTRLRFWKYILRRKQHVACILHAVSVIMKGSQINRTIHCLPKSRDWWENVVLATWTDDIWLANFRMSKASFQFVVKRIEDNIRRVDTNMRKAICVEHRLAITLWRLATNIEFRTLGHLFGVGKSTCCVIVQQTCAALKDVFQPTIKMDTGARLQNSLRGFERRNGFPQVAGAIDGSHIPIKAPRENARDYYNRKGFYSIILQAVVDFSGLFVDICLGWPGSVHDARVLGNSTLYKKLSTDTLFPSDLNKDIDGVEVPVLLLGDPAYPLLKNLIKGFSDNGRLTRQQQIFNTKLSGARCVVERSFGRLKGRWRILDKRNDHALEFVPILVFVCCILHNICEERGEIFHEHWLHDQEHNADMNGHHPRGANDDEEEAQEIRNALMNYMVPVGH